MTSRQKVTALDASNMASVAGRRPECYNERPDPTGLSKHGVSGWFPSRMLQGKTPLAFPRDEVTEFWWLCVRLPG